MGKQMRCSIINKRVSSSNKVMYLLRNGNNDQKWLEFEDLTQYLEEIVKFQKMRKTSKHTKLIGKKMSHIENSKIIDESVDNMEQEDGNQNKIITDILFIQKTSGYLKFKVYFNDGSFKFMTNQQIRKQNYNILLDFYQKYIEVGFDD